MITSSSPLLSHKLAVLVFIQNPAGEHLLIRRAKMPNRGNWSPIGGKVETAQGESPFECAVRETGEEAGFAIVTSRIEAPLQARWIAEMAAYAGKCHPGLRWLGTGEGGEDGALADEQAALLMRRHGAALAAIVPLSNFAAPAVAEAVTRAGRCG